MKPRIDGRKSALPPPTNTGLTGAQTLNIIALILFVIAGAKLIMFRHSFAARTRTALNDQPILPG